MINLLPLKEKKRILSEKRERISKILWFLLLFFLFCLALNLFFITYYLREEINFHKEELSILERETETLEIKKIQREINEINSLLVNLDNFYKRRHHFSEVFEKITERLPVNIFLTNISISGEKEKVKVSISGFSPSREALLGFKEEIEKDSYFKEVHFPSSTWISSLDINFSASFEIYED